MAIKDREIENREKKKKERDRDRWGEREGGSA